MSIFQANQGPAKVAADLTSLAIMNTTSKYVKEGPVPVGSYEQPRKLQPNERYGANRRLQRKPQDANTPKSEIQSQTTQTITSKINLAVDQANLIINKRNEMMGLDKQEVKPTPQTNTPKAQKPEPYTYQKIEKISQTPRNVPQVKSAVEQVLDKTPTQNNRYGSNRRLPSQKIQEPIQKTDSQSQLVLVTEVQAKTIHRTPTKNNQISQSGRPNAKLIKPVGSVTQTKEVKQAVVENTPTQPISRYGANRRAPVQKTEIPIQNTSVLVQPSKQSETTPVQNNQVKPFTRNTQIQTPVSPKTGNLRTPVVQIEPSNQQKAEQKKEIQPVSIPQKTETKALARSNVRPQLRSRIETPVAKKENQIENPKQQKQIKQKKQSKIICFVLGNIFRSKLLPIFATLLEINRASKKKQNFARVFINQLHSATKLINNELYKFAFHKLIRPRPAISGAKLDAGILQSINRKSHKILPISLNRLYVKQLSHVYQKLSECKKKSSNPKYLLNSLNQISIKILSNSFARLKNFSSTRFNYKKRLLSLVNSTSIQYRVKIIEYCFRKISRARRQQGKDKQKQVGSPIHDFDKDLSSQQSSLPSPSPQKSEKDQKLLANLQSALKLNTAKLQKIEQEFTIQRIEAEKRVQSLKVECDELSLQNEQKKKISQQLKQKALSIQFREEDYIQTPDLILDTKFPILYDAYIKVQKWAWEDIKINSLLKMFPGCAEEAGKDKQVSQWTEMGKNLKLKKQVSRYEGESESLRKATKVANQEAQLLSQLSRGYIRERYSWEWVKSALCNAPHS